MTSFFSWTRRARPFPYTRGTAASALALLWLAGGLTGLLAAGLPHPAAMQAGVVSTLSAAAIPVAVALFALRDRVPVTAHPWLLAVGTGIVSVLVGAAGTRSVAVSFSFFYIWVVMYAVLFFPPLVAATQVALVAAGYVAAVLWLGKFAPAAFTAVEPVVLVSVIATTSVVVLALSRARETSVVDPLTRVANRLGLDRVLEVAMDDARTKAEPLTVAMIDVDHFKRINDVGGHEAGDRVLQRLVGDWGARLRAGDTLGRFGGDEFVVVLPRCASADAVSILERLRSAATHGVTCSVGGAQWLPGDSASLLVGRADTALYEAKRLGRNRVVVVEADDAAAPPRP